MYNENDMRNLNTIQGNIIFVDENDNQLIFCFLFVIFIDSSA